MKICSFENYFVDYVTGELDNNEIIEFQSHLGKCPTCSKRLDEFYIIHYSTKSQKRKEPPSELIKEYHQNLDYAFSESKKTNQWSKYVDNLFQTIFWRRSFSFKIAEVVGFILIGIFIGWLIFNPQPEIHTDKNTNPDYFIRPISTAEVEYISYYFQAAELLLLEIKNIEAKSPINKAELEFNKSIAQKLLIKTFIVHEIALRQNDPKILRFLSKMELLLYEVSNVPTEELTQSIDAFSVIIDESKLLDDTRKFQKEIINFQSPKNSDQNLKYDEVK